MGSDTRKIARSAGTVGFAVMCSRVLGLVREQVFAALFGAGYAYDSFVVAFRIPNLLRDLFGEGALSAAFVTVFTDYRENKSKEEMWRLAANVLVAIVVVVSALTLVGILFAGKIIAVLAPDFSLVAGKMALTHKMTVIMFPFLVLVSLSAAVMGMLNTHGRFFVPAMASSFFNLGSITGGIGFSLIMPFFGQPAIVGMALGTILGGLCQLASQLPSLAKIGFCFRPHLDFSDPGLRRIIFLMGPAVIGLSATQINIFINTNFAASCAEGSVSWLNYAFRFVQFPIGIFGVALSIATLPVLSRHAARKDTAALKETFVSSLTMTALLTVPSTVGLMLLAEPIIRIIFQHGAFTALDTLRTAEALRFYLLGLFAYAGVKIMVPVFYAINNTRFPVIGSFLAVAANVIMILVFIDTLQHKAIALATSCAMTANFLFLGVVLYRKLAGYPLAVFMKSLCRILAAALVMALFIHACKNMLSAWMEKGFFQDAAGLSLLVAGGAALYLGIVYLLKVRELQEVANAVCGGIFRGPKQQP